MIAATSPLLTATLARTLPERHLALQEVDDSGSPVTWGEHVTDEEYSVP